MNKQKSLVVHRSDDTHSLPHKSLKTRSSRMRDINAKISNLSLGNNLSNFNSEISSKASRNGFGIVYNKSDCGYLNVRWYGFGGDGSGSTCENYWSLTYQQLQIIWSNGNVNWICPPAVGVWSKGYCWDDNGVQHPAR